MGEVEGIGCPCPEGQDGASQVGVWPGPPPKDSRERRGVERGGEGRGERRGGGYGGMVGEERRTGVGREEGDGERGGEGW